MTEHSKEKKKNSQINNPGRILIILTLILLSSSILTVKSTRADGIIVKRDINYTLVTPDTSPYQKMDIYHRPGAKDQPVMIFIPGGMWGQAKKDQHENIGRAFAARDIVTVIPNSRLMPPWQYPDNALDCAQVVSWVRKNIKPYGGDPELIFLCGHESGGQMAGVLAMNPHLLKKAGLSNQSISGLITITGLHDLREELIHDENAVDRRILSDQLNEYTEGNPVTRTNASPVTYAARKDIPTVLILYGQKDKPYNIDQSKRLYQAMKKYGNSVKIREIKGKDHESMVDNIGTRNDETTDAIVEFIKFRSFD